MNLLSLNNLIRISIINFAIFAGLVVTIGQKPPNPQVNNEVVVSVPSPVITSAAATGKMSPTPTVKQESLSVLASRHNVKSDCWIIYSDHAYDITSYFGSHPGGDAIMLKYCGKDATAAFDTKDKSSASPHSAAAAQLLKEYLVK